MKKKDLQSAAAQLGQRGGKRRALNMTPEKRSEAARRAVQARWAKKKGAP